MCIRDSYIIWQWIKKNASNKLIPKELKLITTGTTRKKDQLIWNFELVSTDKKLDPKEYTVTVIPDIPQGNVKAGSVIGRAIIEKKPDNKQKYRFDFDFKAENADPKGDSYLINIFDGNNNPLPQRSARIGKPVLILRENGNKLTAINVGSTNDYFFLDIPLIAIDQNESIADYAVTFDNDVLEITRPGNGDSVWPTTVQIFKPMPTTETTYTYVEHHKYYNLDIPEPPPVSNDDPRYP